MTFRLLIFLAFFILQDNNAFSKNQSSFGNEIGFQVSNDIFDKDRLDELKASDDYNYTEKIETSGWWSAFKEWIWLQIQKLFGDDIDPNSFLFKILRLLPYVVPLIAIIIIVWYIIRTNPGSQVMRQHNKSKVILTEEEELLMERDLTKLAEEAIANKELRLAVRYLYLNCIKRLDMKRIIRYANDKTNYEYIMEIQFPEVAEKFRSLTLSYEQIWYGQMVFDEAYFQNYKSNSEKFHRLLDQKQYAKA